MVDAVGAEKVVGENIEEPVSPKTEEVVATLVVAAAILEEASTETLVTAWLSELFAANT